jgi:hypothetical protein
VSCCERRDGGLRLPPDELTKADDKRVSLAGLDPEEALRALLKVDPDVESELPEDEPQGRDEKVRRRVGRHRGVW